MAKLPLIKDRASKLMNAIIFSKLNDKRDFFDFVTKTVTFFKRVFKILIGIGSNIGSKVFFKISKNIDFELFHQKELLA